MKALTVNDSARTSPESIFLEFEDGVYTAPSKVVTGFIDPEPLLTIAKKCFDGITLCAVNTDNVSIYWRRDLDVSPIQVAQMNLFGRVWHNSAWVQQQVSFDYVTDPDVNAQVVTAGEHYRVFQDLDALGTDNHFGVDFQFTKGLVDFKFMVHSAGKPVECLLDTYIIDASLAANRPDGRGIATPSTFDGVDPEITPDTPTAGRTRYRHTWERTTPCEATNGRTNVELFAQDAGLSVR
jgi:hypothetical protein